MFRYIVDYRLIKDFFHFTDGECIVNADSEKLAYAEAEKHLYETKKDASYIKIKAILQLPF